MNATAPARPAASPPRSPLAALNDHIERVSGVSVRGTGSTPWPELRSAQRFRETWERLGAEVQVQQARERAPQNAGPLNPQRLMLATLAHMGELSPHYLRRFLAHTDTLLWLEQVLGQRQQGVAVPTGTGTGPEKKTARKKK
ncbi:MAG: DUF2894 domain-containing protein [Hydrogenophaga sp.]